jgi:hypothetical protein
MLRPCNGVAILIEAKNLSKKFTQGFFVAELLRMTASPRL